MLKLYNTLTRKKEIFKPIKKNNVGMYTCGPTIYDYAHIGNFRAYLVADLLKRYLKYSGYKVKHIMNLTDVDDKTIKVSQEKKISLKEFTEKYKKAFFKDLEALDIEKADIYPCATENIKEMVSLVQTLLDKKYAYKGKDGSIYFDVSKFKNYSKLAKLKIKNLKAGVRIKQDEYEKEDINDFALWKAYSKSDGDVFWNTKIGKGRPGWHLECSAMSSKYLGKQFDIHTGGIDLIFPHHTNEIAQSESAFGKKFVNYWIHNEWLLVNGKKMSKSLGNFYTLRDLLKEGYDTEAIRYVLLSTHYRQSLNFTFEGVESSKKAIERLNNFIKKIWILKTTKEGVTINKQNPEIKKLIKKTKDKFVEKMDDDLNISKALSVIFDFIRNFNKKIDEIGIYKKDAEDIYNFMKEINSVFWIMDFEEKKENVSKEIKDLIDEREKARKDKNYKKADDIRDKLKKKGIILEDTKEGVKWKIN